MTTTALDRQSDLREWGSVARSGFSPMEWTWLAVVLGVPGVVLSLIAALLAGAPALVAVALGYCLLAWWWLTRQARAAVKGLGRAGPLPEADAPRLFNLVRGLARELGLEAPRLLVFHTDEAANAFVGRAKGPVIAVTNGLLERYTRTELEAVVAHSLIRLSSGDGRRAVVAAALGGLAGPAGVMRHDEVDLRTVALTRYPPALASAIAQATPSGGTRGAFWFVPAASGSASQSERVARLSDL